MVGSNHNYRMLFDSFASILLFVYIAGLVVVLVVLGRTLLALVLLAGASLCEVFTVP